ncbi:enoyl-CoA hydratase/isomerase family protein [Streptomyces paludis]|uniref:3-hydroxyisobutyryl-CoA hydrolase n=1 Tax=Streptomyces paludis TaxID=2282738 RepID=A0A345HK19_9ACTN|nr:enoyl-CoA hydratase/isomerase family protein [Streptomyces paludis]AXG77043.1 enoyl-CoA hydratase/isomerase family protein [Streptomyces paludis]
MTGVTTSVRAGVAHLVLDRAAALNALDEEMVALMRAALFRWRDDPDIDAVVVRSALPKAFCAGGDVRALRAAALRGERWTAHSFLRAEYALNRAIAGYPKPYVSLIDGVAMGGGLGISVHGAVRVATERAVFAMPETAIGFVPDVGACYFLPRLPGAYGRYLGLTGARLDGPRAVTAGLATHFVASAELPDFIAALGTVGLDDLLAKTARPVPAAPDGLRAAVDAVFAPGSLGEIEERLRTRVREAAPGDGGDGTDGGAEWARRTLALLAAASPLSLRLTDELLRLGARDDLIGCLRRDLAVASRLVHEPDFAEGVRAVLVDKTRDARWTHPSPAAVPDESVRALLAGE